MQTDTLGALVWGGLVLCYAWSVRNLARMGRRPPASDASAGGIRIAVGTRRPSGHAQAVATGGGDGTPEATGHSHRHHEPGVARRST
jgi:hypothetical protein